ncbi:MAG: T9SS type A sorting domain-containing protein [Bacteroidales bacterium]|nr:T9SS type A sorting domain-containing protein [Bacteroidales bacterium]
MSFRLATAIFLGAILFTGLHRVNAQDITFLKNKQTELNPIIACFETETADYKKHTGNEIKINYRLFHRENYSLPDTFVDLTRYKQLAIFMVYVSPEAGFRNIVTLTDTMGRVAFNNNHIQNGQTGETLSLDAYHGVIVSYELSSNDTKKGRMLSFKEYLNNTMASDQQLLEVIILPYLPDEQKRNAIETYLSVKYGISLSRGISYYSTTNKQIWNGENSNYQYRVTGIGFDSGSYLRQKQSHNNFSPQLSIGYDSIYKSNDDNKSFITDQHFLLWGDDGNDFTFVADSTQPIKTSLRSWKAQLTDKQNLNKSFHIELSQPGKNFSNDSLIWLLVTDSLKTPINGTYYKGVTKNNSTHFSRVSLGNSNDTVSCSYFTFIQTGLLAAIAAFDTASCICPSMANLHIRVLGGMAPFTFKIYGTTLARSTRSKEPELRIDNLLPGDYQISITDSLGNEITIQKRFDNPIAIVDVVLPEASGLGAGASIELDPIFSDNQSVFYQTEWYLADQLLSKEPTIRVNQPGDYSLIVTDETGCKRQFITSVKPNELITAELFSLHPNPVRTGHPFTLDLTRLNSGQCTISITDALGKTISQFRAESGETVKRCLSISGVFFVRVESKARSYQIKLIVI